MDNLIFALNATVPLFLMMVLGLFFRYIKLFNDSFVKTANSFVFKAALPAALFYDLSNEDFFAVWDAGFVIFCFCVTAVCITAAIVISKLCFKNDPSLTGEFAQASYRSSAAILGIGFIENLYGNAGMSPLMIAATVPLYNVMAVVLLSFFKPGGGSIDRKLIIKTLKGIVTNPIIIGIAVGILWSVLSLPKPQMIMKTVKYLTNVSTPMGLMAVGASFDIKKAFGKLKPAVTAAVLKLIVWCVIFLPLAIKLGFANDKLISILVMLGSPTTVSCFIMAKNMGHEGTLTSSTVMLTTMLSAFTLTGWLYILKVLGLV